MTVPKSNKRKREQAQNAKKQRRHNLSIRVIVKGNWFAPGKHVKHGTNRAYNHYGCRCAQCCDNMSRYMKKYYWRS